ncbi:MAG: hypothetical protein H0W62_12940 [Chitinophagales bacterium]|nr:hypothetical protein [Chitinophagales bacterium]
MKKGVLQIKAIPFVTYGKNKVTYYYDGSKDTSNFYMDIFFPEVYNDPSTCTGSCGTDPLQGSESFSDSDDEMDDSEDSIVLYTDDQSDDEDTTSQSDSELDGLNGQANGDALTDVIVCKYPVMLFLPGGGFSSAYRDSVAAIADSLAARGFIVATINYRTAPHVQCDDTANNYVLLRAVQDARLALRALVAVEKGKYSLNALGYKLKIPFLDMDNIFIGGSSAGSVTALTTAYYDECDINDALSHDNSLKKRSLEQQKNSHHDIICGNATKTIYFDLDQQPNTLGDDSVHLYFTVSASNTAAPIDKIQAVMEIKGGVPDNGFQIDSVDANNPNTLPPYVADDGTEDDIPMIGFQGVNDATVPFLSNAETTFVLDAGGTGMCPPYLNDKPYDFCRDNVVDKCHANGHRHVFGSGFLWGSKKIYDALKDASVKTQLYAVPGTGHSFEKSGGNKYPFIFAQSAIFCGNALCNKGAITRDFDSVMNYTVNASSIAFDNDCFDPTRISIHFNLTNNNKAAVITTLSVKPQIFQNGGNQNLVDNPSGFVEIPYTASDYLPVGNTGEFIINQIALTPNSTIFGTIKIVLSIKSINGFADSAFIGPSTHKLDSVIRNKTGTGCFNTRLEQASNDFYCYLYPNPSGSSFQIDASETPIAFFVYDLQGRLVELGGQYFPGYAIGKNLPRGAYLIKIAFSRGNTQVLKGFKE